MAECTKYQKTRMETSETILNLYLKHYPFEESSNNTGSMELENSFEITKFREDCLYRMSYALFPSSKLDFEVRMQIINCVIDYTKQSGVKELIFGLKQESFRVEDID